MRDVKKGLRIFGDVKSGGAIINISNVDDGIEMHKFILRQIADYENIPPSFELDILIHNMARELHAKQLTDIKSRGISDNILNLLSSKDKKSAQRLARSMTIQYDEFAHLTYNYGDYGYSKDSKFFEYVPDHLIPTEEEKLAFQVGAGKGPLSKEAQKFLRKITNTLKERKNICAHLFTKDDEWHCFYFTYHDMAGKRIIGKSHWSGGDHIHYISNLWNKPKEEVWAELSNKSYAVGGEHIRYKERKIELDEE